MFTRKIFTYPGIFCLFFFGLVSCTSNDQGSATTPTANPSDPDYMKGCFELNPAISQEQIVYRNVFPGHTDSVELERLLGLPDVITPGYPGQAWDYGPSLFRIFEGIVTEVLVTSGDPDFISDFAGIISAYGCPNVIIAAEDPEGAQGSYEWTILGYHTRGFDVRFFAYPITLSEPVSSVGYFEPMSLEEYISNFGYRVIYVWKFVSWDEAIQEK